MNALAKIRQCGFTVSSEDDDKLLVYPKSQLTPELRYFIRQNKAEILRALKAADEPALHPGDKIAILGWLKHIGETDPVEREDVLEYCRTDPEEREKYLKDIQERFIPGMTQDSDAPPTAPPESENGGLSVVCYTPTGIPIRLQANDAAHADWLIRMNPKT